MSSVYTDLQGEQHNCKADHDGDAHCHDDRIRVIIAGDHARHVGQTQGQDGLKK